MAEEKSLPTLDARTKWSYCIGATGRDAAYAFISLFLMTYVQYTMKLTVAQFSVISLCMVICLVWDAINDPMMGIIIENSHFKAGKYKPWILAGCILNALVITALFTFRPTGWGFVAFFGVSYLLWGMTYTMNDISYWGMLPSLSSDAATRNSLVTIMSIFICLGQFVVAGVVPTIIAGNAVNAFRWSAYAVAMGFILFQILVVVGCKERPRNLEKEAKAEKLTLGTMFRIFKRNDQLIASGVAELLFHVGSSLLTMFGANFFFFEFGYSTGGSLIFLFTVMYGLGTLFSQALYDTMTKKFSRMKLLSIATVVEIIGYLALMACGYLFPMSAVAVNIIGFVIFFFQGFSNLIIIVMLNNTIEYDEYRFHERHDSVIAAIRSFAVKLGTALEQGLVTVVLIISGIYTASQQISSLETDAGKGLLTSEQVTSAADEFIRNVEPYQTLLLRLGMVLFPIIALVGAWLLLKKKYRIDEAEYQRIVDEIAERHE
ncbi:MAG: MFS transporter [Treponema sp.]|nr:MFS transporter [Candidatus Treponema caballi]